MNKLHEMGQGQGKISFTPQPSLGKYLAIHTLPLLITIFLIYWLSGGIPPTIVGSVIQAFANVGQLWREQGTSVLPALFFIIIQLLLLILSWGLVLWFLYQERVVVLTVLPALKKGQLPSLRTTMIALEKPNTRRSPFSIQQLKSRNLPLVPRIGASAAALSPQFPNANKTPGNTKKAGFFSRQRKTANELFLQEEKVDYVFGDPFEKPQQAEGVEMPQRFLVEELFAANPLPLPTNGSPYTFGNPFSGELPDILKMDTESKTSVDDLPVENQSADAFLLDTPPLNIQSREDQITHAQPEQTMFTYGQLEDDFPTYVPDQESQPVEVEDLPTYVPPENVLSVDDQHDEDHPTDEIPIDTQLGQVLDIDDQYEQAFSVNSPSIEEQTAEEPQQVDEGEIATGSIDEELSAVKLPPSTAENHIYLFGDPLEVPIADIQVADNPHDDNVAADNSDFVEEPQQDESEEMTTGFIDEELLAAKSLPPTADDHLYVFGDPFSGELPDVSQLNLDLKTPTKDQQGDLHSINAQDGNKEKDSNKEKKE